MTLTKIQIVESVQNQTGFPKNRSSEIVETLLEIIKSTWHQVRMCWYQGSESSKSGKRLNVKAGIQQLVRI